MAETDYYPRFGGDTPSRGGPPPPPPKTPEQKDKEQEGDYATFLVAKSALGGATYRPGDKVTMEVEHVYDDEYEMCIADDAKEEKETETKSESRPMSADEELDGMDMMKG